jgi:hypothetical protein
MRRFTVGTREIDLDRAEVRGPQGSAPLTPNEVKVLAVLAARAGQVVERDVLLCEALGYRQAVNTRAIDQAVWRLRRKVEPEPHCPRWLLSEANIGYRLELDPPPLRTLIGRMDDLSRLLALLDEGRRVVVVGLPGVGRRTLIAAAATRGAEVAVADAVPDDPALTPLRIGPLAPEAGRALLIREVLGLRGDLHLSEDEEAEATAAAARAGHHPATLRRMAEGSVLHRLGQLEVPVVPEVAAHVAALTPEVREVLAQCAPFPDAFLPDEVGASPAALTLAWRASVLDSVEGPGGERRLVVPPCVRAAFPLDPAHPASRAFVARVVASAVPPAIEVLRRLDDAARCAVLAERGRVDAALRLAPDDEQRRALLPALLARWAATDELPDAVPPHEDPLTSDQAVCVDLLQAFAAERVDRGAGEVHIDRAIARPGVSATFACYALRVAFARATWNGGQREAMVRCIEALEQLSAAQPDPPVVASFHHARGILRLRAGDAEGAREDLVRAMALFGPGSTAQGNLATNLADEAARDGRVGEALAWFDQLDPSRSPPNEEARKRLQRASILQLAGRLAEAARELGLAEMLGSRSWTLGLGWATQALLEGRVDEAVVQAEAVHVERPQLGEAAVALPMVLGWARVAQGLGDRALALVDGCAPALLTHPEYQAQLALLRAAALSRSARTDGVAEAEAVLDAVVPVRRRWWPLTRRIVGALVRGDAREATNLAEQLERAGLASLVARFAVVAVAQGEARPQTQDAASQNRPVDGAREEPGRR